MYSNKIKPKIERMFNTLRTEAEENVVDSHSLHNAVDKICHRVNLETAIRSKAMLSDMLFDLNDQLFQTSFFVNNISLQNDFFALDLRQEIIDKYQLVTTTNIEFHEVSHITRAVKVGAGTLAVGGICGLGVARVAGLSFLSFTPVPVGVLFAAALGAMVVDYVAIEPSRNKKKLTLALDKYFIEVQQQYLNWFDEIESYYNKRVDEFKDTIG